MHIELSYLLLVVSQEHAITTTSAVIADSLISVQIQTRGGFQVADFLTAWAIPYWLTGVKTSRIKDEKKSQTILLFDVLEAW